MLPQRHVKVTIYPWVSYYLFSDGVMGFRSGSQSTLIHVRGPVRHLPVTPTTPLSWGQKVKVRETTLVLSMGRVTVVVNHFQWTDNGHVDGESPRDGDVYTVGEERDGISKEVECKRLTGASWEVRDVPWSSVPVPDPTVFTELLIGLLGSLVQSHFVQSHF